MPNYTPRLNLPLPLGTENVTRQAHLDLVNAVDANAATRKDPEAIAADIFASGFVISGMVASKNVTLANQLDVTTGECYIQQTVGGLRRFAPAATSFITSVVSTVYYLDFQSDGTHSWGTAHSTQAGYLPITEVTTDSAGNIVTVTDKRPLTPGVGKALPAAHKSSHASGGADALTTADIGAETPAGAQAKVDAHIAAADPHPQYTTDVDFNTHLADTVPHGATALATANKIALRDANGNVVSALPVTNRMNPNLLFNPTWALGSSGWSGIGANGFSVESVFNGSQLKNTTSSTTLPVQADNSNNFVPALPGVTYTVSGEINASGVTAGMIGIQWYAFDSAKVAISGGVVGATNGQGWTKYSLAFTTPANTAYLQVACVMGPNTTNTSAAWRKIKLEEGSVATTYSDDNTLNTVQYGGALPLAQILSGGNRFQSGVGPNMTVVTAGTAVTAVVTFPVAFPGTTTPAIYGFLAGTYADAGYVNLKVIAGSPTGFTFQLNSYIPETVGTYWLAIGT